MAARECLRWPPRRTHIASTRQPCQGAPLRSITFPSKQQHGRSEQSWQGLLINSVITRNHPHLAYHHHHSMFMISKDVNGVGGVLSVRIKKDLQQQQRQQQQRWSRCGLQPSHHHSHRQHNNKDENYSYDQYNDDHNHHCHCPRKNFNGTPIASAVTEGRRREVCPFPFCGAAPTLFPFFCGFAPTPFPFFEVVAPTLFHWFCSLLNKISTRKQGVETCSTKTKRTSRDTLTMTTTTLWTMSDFKTSRLIQKQDISAELSSLHARTFREWGWRTPQEEATLAQELQVAMEVQVDVVIYEDQEEE